MILYHGTTKENAERILHEGFKPDQKYNWRIKSKPGFVYLSLAYAPFYAMNAKSRNNERAIVQVEVEERNLYPDDDFIMVGLGKPKYSQKQLDSIDLRDYKHLAHESLEHMGNACARPEHVKVLGIRVFDMKGLIMVCDPVICPANYLILGEYYRKLTEWIYEGNKPIDFSRSDRNPNKFPDEILQKYKKQHGHLPDCCGEQL